METYRGNTIKVEFPGPGDATGVTAQVTYWGKSGDTWGTITEDVVPDVTNAVTLAYRHVYESDIVRVSWSWDEFTLTQNVEVVNKILDMDRLSTLLNETDPDKLQDFERRARYKIESITGQKFNTYHATKTIYGNNDTSIELPERLISFDSIESGGTPGLVGSYALRGDGWRLDRLHDYPSETEYYSNPIGYFRHRDFSDQVQYTISGTWGWEDVPEPVKQAALIIAAGYACTEDSLRDKYIASMRTQVFSVTFDPRAQSGTGSVDADLLLSPYIVLPLMVL